jgi:hypothetical protein
LTPGPKNSFMNCFQSYKLKKYKDDPIRGHRERWRFVRDLIARSCRSSPRSFLSAAIQKKMWPRFWARTFLMCSKKILDADEIRRIAQRLGSAACLFVLLAACGGRIGTLDLSEELAAESCDDRADAGPIFDEKDKSDAGAQDSEIALEEMEMEDPDALADIIREKLASERPAEPASVQPLEPRGRIPNAVDNWRLTKKQCFDRLDKEGVTYTKPGFETPTVGAPLFLTGPVGGVEFKPRWPQSENINAVMDCHLALALVEVANQARAIGVKEIQFYSTYRPINAPPKTCKKGKAGERCRRLKKAYKKAKKKPSQHRAALAIDMRWLITNRDETIDVLTHFDRRSGTPPCEYDASTYFGRLLQSFACEIYRERIFNVMLTPNANKAHRNHFHFDITPNAKWYIIR